MAIEIRELLIKVRIEETQGKQKNATDMETLKRTILKDCKKEIFKQLKKRKER